MIIFERPHIPDFDMLQMAHDATDMGVVHPACRNIRLMPQRQEEKYRKKLGMRVKRDLSLQCRKEQKAQENKKRKEEQRTKK